MEPQFTQALAKLRELFETASQKLQTPISCALIGGLALSTWGIPRATEDIDFLADSEPSPLVDKRLRDNLKEFMEQEGCETHWRMGGPDDPIPLLLRMELPRSYSDLSVDILWVHKRWQREALRRSVALNVMGQRINGLHPEGLILMKLEAGGPQDLLDVQSLLSSRSRKISIRRLKIAATRLRLSAILETCLNQVGSGGKPSPCRNRK